MKRGRNRSSSNSTLDMTPMLDVVFLVLFIVVMAYAKAGTSTIISETEYENKVSSYEYATEQYNKLLEKVELLTITCTYNTNYNRFRSVTILSDGEIEPKYQDSFEDSNRRAHMEKLKVFLENYAMDHSEKILFIDLDDNNILHKDYEDISRMISLLKECFPDSVKG